jgi:hypothetical protein
MGCIYQPKKSPFLWIKFYANGRAHYESAKTDKIKVAEKILKDREGAWRPASRSFRGPPR